MNFQGYVTVQLSRFFVAVFATALIFYHTLLCLSRSFLTFFEEVFLSLDISVIFWLYQRVSWLSIPFLKFFNQSAQQLEIIPPVFPLVNIFFYFFSNSSEHQRNEKSDYAKLFAIRWIFYFGMGGTARRPVACCFEHPEQLHLF